MGKCSELAQSLVDVARLEIKLGAKDFDEVYSRMAKTLPWLSQSKLANSVVEVSRANAKARTELQNVTQRIFNQAKNNVKLREKARKLINHLKQKTVPKKQARVPGEITKTEKDLRQMVSELEEQVKNSDVVQKERLIQQIDRLDKKIRSTGTEQPTVKEDDLPSRPELQKLVFERDNKQKQLRQKIESLKPKKVFDRATEWGNTLRSWLTTGEFSGVLRQSLLLSVSRPIEVGKSMRDMFSVFADPSRNAWLERQWQDDLDVQHWIRSGLGVTWSDSPMAQQEEMIMARYAGDWVNSPIGKALAPLRPLLAAKTRFDLAYGTFLNSIRINSAKAIAQATVGGAPTVQERQAISAVVNVLSGRGNIDPSSKRHLPLANLAMFAPLYQLSRIQYLTGQPLWNMTAPHLRLKLAKEMYGKQMFGLGAMYALYSLFFGGEEEYDLAFNPLSSDFGKIRLGQTRIDPLGGFSQWIHFASEVGWGERITLAGDRIPIRGPEKKFGEKSILGQYLRSKSSPIIGNLWSAIDGETMIGEPYGPSRGMEGMKNMFFGMGPITYGDMADVMQQEDIALPRRTAIALLSFFGVGASVYKMKNGSGGDVPQKSLAEAIKGLK